MGLVVLPGEAHMELLLLGPVQAAVDDRPVDLGVRRQRLVLAVLALEVNKTVTIDRLIELLWLRDPPATARGIVHTCISGLRAVLATSGTAARIMRDGSGYRLTCDPDHIDAHRFRTLIAQARHSRDKQRITMLTEALALWRGPALAGTAPEEVRARLCAGLEEAKLTAAENLLEVRLRLGRDDDLLEDALSMAADHPFRPRPVRALMKTLQQAGRVAEALETYRRFQRNLCEDQGLDPPPDLRELYMKILRSEPEPEPEGRRWTRTRPTQLPAGLSTFSGRDREVKRLLTLTAPVIVIDGMAGVGKTALAVNAAHRLAPSFPDGQLFLDLHAHTPGRRPVLPGDAIAELLAADGIDPRFVPPALDGRAALWRDRMAGRRLLLVLDNAARTKQVLPLLPGSPNCLVLITSRRSLGDLPAAVFLPLDVLAPDEAAAIFVRLAHRAADPLPVADLVRTCGYLPLAISITASVYRRHQSWTIGDLLEEVHRSAGGLLTIKAEDRTVAAVFDLSYHHLSPDRQRFFRLLGLHPGADIDAYAAAALTDTLVDVAAGHLDELHGDHLLEEPVHRRYRMHDLIRSYAQTLAMTTDPADLRDQAMGRLLDFYQHTAARADTFMARYARTAGITVAAPAVAPEITTSDQAATWLRTERANLLACIRHTTTRQQHERTVGLTAGIATLLYTDGPWTQAITVHEAAATAAHQLGDRHVHAGALHDQALARQLAGDYLAAGDLLDRALDLYQAVEDRLGQANALYELGVVRWLTGHYRAAADLLNQALDLYQAAGDRRGQATVLHWLGVVRWVTGDYPAAIHLLDQALNLHRALGDRRGQANALHELGVVRQLTGNYPAATHLLEQALNIYRALGHRRGQATALNWLGVVRQLTGHYRAAARLHRKALTLCRARENRLGQAIALNHLGVVRSQTADYPAATHLLDQALNLHRALGHRHGEAIASTRQAVVRYLTSDYTGATDLLHQALAVFREIGAPDNEAEALNHLATVRRLTGQPDQAHTLHQQALDIARRIQHRLEEAHALDGIGRAAVDLGDTNDGITHLRHALDIYEQLGVPEATQVAVALASLTQPLSGGVSETLRERR